MSSTSAFERDAGPAAPLCGSIARNLMRRHRGLRWTIHQAHDRLADSTETGQRNLASRLVASTSWEPWLDASASGESRRLQLSSHGVVEQNLQTLDDNVRWRMTRALGALEPASLPQQDLVVNRLNDVDHTVRWAAAEALGRTPSVSKGCIENLACSSRHDHSGAVRRAAQDSHSMHAHKPDGIPRPVCREAERHRLMCDRTRAERFNEQIRMIPFHPTLPK